MLRVYIRTDASEAIGSGHLMRCLSLAERLKARDCQVIFICCDLPGNLIPLLELNGYTVLKLPVTLCQENNWNWESDATETMAFISANCEQADWVVVDHYELDARWETLLRPHTHKVMVIDDLTSRLHDCDLLLNQNLLGSFAIHKIAGPTTKVLLGPLYALLRDEFMYARLNAVSRSEGIHRIVIFFGGSDLTGETIKTLTALSLLDISKLHIDVIVGAGNPKKEEVRRLCNFLPNTFFHCQISNMAYFLSRADLALGAAGVTCWERLAVGLPAVVVAVADNQIENMQQLDKLGVAIGIGISSQVDVKDYIKAINKMDSNPEMLKEMSEKAFSMVDCNGTNRVIEMMMTS